jgi:RNase adaptor protein for sRNA GlmZ degradation
MPHLKLIAENLKAPVVDKWVESSTLTVSITSFSYRKGIPPDPSDNGGGFVFDCRSIHNPGRYDEYKQLTGKDQAVIDFFERENEMDEFLEKAFRLVDKSVEVYQKRCFGHLMVSFGCTGGQHRSVYSAERLASHLKEKYSLNINLWHREQD